jgi:hypothetical protein
MIYGLMNWISVDLVEVKAGRMYVETPTLLFVWDIDGDREVCGIWKRGPDGLEMVSTTISQALHG